MTSVPGTRQSANLFKNYNRLISIAYTLIIVALILFFAHLLQRKMNEEIDLIGGHVSRHAQFFEFVLRSSADHLETLRMSASKRPDQIQYSGSELLDRPPGSWLEEDSTRHLFHLDALPAPDEGGNLIGLGTLHGRSQEFYEDLNTALRINFEWSSLIFTLPSAVQASFLFEKKFKAIFPWQHSSSLFLDTDVYEKPVWTMGLPSNNPDREKYWAPVYFAGKDIGLLAPEAAPVYSGSRFVGVIVIDTSIDYLNRINSDFTYPLGFTLLVDRRQHILAHPELYAKPLEVDATPSLTDAIPLALSNEIDRLRQLTSGEPIRINGYLVIRQALTSAPWSLFYVVPESALWWRLGSVAGPSMLVVMLGLVVLMSLTYFLTSREFVGPADKLVRHIAAASNFEPTTIPTVPSGWRPWFETITRAFQESMQLIALRQELDIAAKIQQSILPRHWPEHDSYTLWGKMRPAKEVGGDFYDHFDVAETMRGIVVADVSGKGIPAGLFGMVSKTLLRSAATQGSLDIGKTITKVNDDLSEENDTCMFVTLFYARFDPSTAVLEFVNAGHPSPLLIHADGRIEYLDGTDGMALGVMSDIDYNISSIRLSPGDTLLMFTDGVTEAINAASEEFGTQRLSTLLTGKRVADPSQIVEMVFEAVDQFANGIEQFDDITCVALRYRGVNSKLDLESDSMEIQ
jgi:phosphoserine phosphatase RsbU/P